MPDATIHLRVPYDQKGRWVRESRTAGLRLSDWITRAVEAQHPEIYHDATQDAPALKPIEAKK